MINNYKKGDLLTLTYVVKGEEFWSTGIVLDISRATLTLAHNFKGTSAIDVTKISIKSVYKSRKVTPKEINSLTDLGCK